MQQLDDDDNLSALPPGSEEELISLVGPLKHTTAPAAPAPTAHAPAHAAAPAVSALAAPKDAFGQPLALKMYVWILPPSDPTAKMEVAPGPWGIIEFKEGRCRVKGPGVPGVEQMTATVSCQPLYLLPDAMAVSLSQREGLIVIQENRIRKLESMREQVKKILGPPL